MCCCSTSPIRGAIEVVGALDTPGSASGIAALGDRVAVADGDAGLLWLDLSDPARPTHLATVEIEGSAARVTIASDHAVVAVGRVPWQAEWPGAEGSLAVVDLADDAGPTLRATLDPGGAPLAVASDGTTAFAAVRRPAAQGREADEALVVVDVDGPGEGDDAPWLLGAGRFGDGISREGLATSLAPHGRYVIAGGERLRVVDLYDPTKPALLRRLDAGAAALALSPAGAVLALPGGGVSLHRTGRGGQLYHVASRAEPGVTVGVLPWSTGASEVHGGASAGTVGLVDRGGLWAVAPDSSQPGRRGEIAPIGAPYVASGGSVQASASLDRGENGDPGALLLVDGGAAGTTLDVVEESGHGPVGRGAWRGALAPVALTALREGPHAILLDTAEVVAAPSSLAMHVVDLRDPALPERVAAVPTLAGTAVVTWHEVVFALGESLTSWWLGDHPLEDGDGPALPARLDELPGPADTLAVVEGTVYTHDGDVIRVVDATDPTAMSEQARWHVPGPPRGIAVDRQWIAVALGDAGVALLDRQAGPERMARFDTAGQALALHLDGDHLWVADGDGGLLRLVIDVHEEAPTPTVVAARELERTSAPAAPRGSLRTWRESATGASEGHRVSGVTSEEAETGDSVTIGSSVGGDFTVMAIEPLSGWACVGQGLRVACGVDEAAALSRLPGAPELAGVVRDLAWGLSELDAHASPTGRRPVYAALSGTGLQVLDFDGDSGLLRPRGLARLPDAVALAVQPVVVNDAVEGEEGARAATESTAEFVWVASGALGSLYRVVTVDLDEPTIEVTLPGTGEAYDLVADGEHLFVAAGEGGLAVYASPNLGDPSLAPIATTALTGSALGLAMVPGSSPQDGPRLYVAGGAEGVHGVDVADPLRPVRVWTVPQPIDPPLGPVGETRAVAAVGPFVVAAGRYDPAAAGAGLRLLLPQVDAAPLPVAMLALPGEAVAITPVERGVTAGSAGWVALGPGGLHRFRIHVQRADDIRVVIEAFDREPRRASLVAASEDGALWLGEGGDRPRLWSASAAEGFDVNIHGGVALSLPPRALAADGGQVWALLEGDRLRSADADTGERAGSVPGRRAVLPAPGAVALAARAGEAAWVAPAPEGDLEPDLRLVGLGRGRSLAVTRRQPLPGAARDVALPGEEGAVLVAGGAAGLLAIQLAEAGRTPVVWDGALNAPARHVAVAGDTAWVDDGRGRLHRLWLERPALPKLLGSVALPSEAPLRDLSAGDSGAWLVLEDGVAGFVDATVAITQTTLITRALPAPALQIAATHDGTRAVAAAGAAGWLELRSPLAEPPTPPSPAAIFIPKAER